MTAVLDRLTEAARTYLNARSSRDASCDERIEAFTTAFDLVANGRHEEAIDRLANTDGVKQHSTDEAVFRVRIEEFGRVRVTVTADAVGIRTQVDWETKRRLTGLDESKRAEFVDGLRRELISRGFVEEMDARDLHNNRNGSNTYYGSYRAPGRG